MCQSRDCGCPEKKCNTAPCGCQALISSNCVNNVLTEFSCFQIESGQTLTETLQQIDEQFCQKIEDLSGATLINVGEGTPVYKGDNLAGDKEIRSIKSVGDIVTVGLNEAGTEIEISIDPEAIKPCIVSDSLNISEDEDGCTQIELVETSEIQTLYVNTLFEPTYAQWLRANSQANAGTPVIGYEYKGEGLLARPFTDTRVFTLGDSTATPTVISNTSIQNALDNYVGTGTRLLPQKLGQKIIVQDNNSGYIFAGDFNYSNLNVEIQSSILSTTTGLLIDMDNTVYFNTTNANVTITLGEGCLLTVSGDGFINSGNSVATTTYATGRGIVFKGYDGVIRSTQNTPTKYIFNSDIANSGNNNDGNLTFLIECTVISDFQGIYSVGGNSRIDFFGTITSGSIVNTVDASLKAFHMRGGTVRFFNNAQINIFGGTRTDGITFTPTGGFIPAFIVSQSSLRGAATNLFTKTNLNNAMLEITNLNGGYDLTIINVFESPNLWSVLFKNNILASGEIDATKADLTSGNLRSSLNTIGGNIVETLVNYPTRTTAQSILPIYSKFINTNSNNVDKSTWFIDITVE